MAIRKFSKIFLFFLSVVFVFPLFSFAQNNTSEEIMTFETYYPAPFGVYNEMRAKKMAIGDTYYNGSQYCWSPATCSNQIDGTTSSCFPNCNTDLVVEGNVGIGTASPTAKLNVEGTASGSNGLVEINRTSSSGQGNGTALKISMTEGGSGWSGVNGNLIAAYHTHDGGVTDTRFLVTEGGNVGIGTGTTVPVAKLDINASGSGSDGAHIQWGRVIITPGKVAYSPSTAFQVDAQGTGVPAASFLNGNVGIGTTSPDYKLSFGPDQGGVSNILAFVDEASPNNAMRGIGAYNSGGVYGLGFWASLGDAATVSNTRMFIDANTGNVGIGTATPLYRMDIDAVGGGPGLRIVSQNTAPTNIISSVCKADNTGATSLFAGYSNSGNKLRFTLVDTGSAYATGDWVSRGLDYAEYFENLNEGVIEKGTIAALENGKVRIARKDDDFIIGPVSTSPGFVGNNGDIEEEREKYPEKWTLVSLMGQVPVKVRGKIKQGDYIELDDNGVGRKAANWHPEVIGRAMEAHNSEDAGRITVLVK